LNWPVINLRGKVVSTTGASIFPTIFSETRAKELIPEALSIGGEAVWFEKANPNRRIEKTILSKVFKMLGKLL
jgi:hypothetical protein